MGLGLVPGWEIACRQELASDLDEMPSLHHPSAPTVLVRCRSSTRHRNYEYLAPLPRAPRRASVAVGKVVRD